MIFKHKTRLPQSVILFSKSLSSLAGPSVLGSLISFVTLPLLANWFSPAQFGQTGNALAIASILAGLATMRIDMIIYSPDQKDNRAILATSGLKIAIVVSFLLFIIILLSYSILLREQLYFALKMSAMISIFTAGLAVTNIGSAYLISNGKYLFASIPRMLNPILVIGICFSYVYFDSGNDNAFIVANMISSIIIAVFCGYKPFFASNGRIEGGIVRFLAYRRRNVMYSVAQSVVGAASFLNLFMVLVTICYGESATGSLFMAYRVFGFPANVLGAAAGSLLSANIEKMVGGGLRQYLIGMIAFGLFIYVPIFVITLLLPNGIVPHEWQTAVELSAPIVVLCFASFSIGSFGQLMLVWERAGQFLIWDLLRLFFTLAGAYLCWFFGFGLIVTVWVFVSIHVMAYVIFGGMLLLHSSRAATV